MQWIEEVELVDAVHELRSSSSIRSVPMPDFEVLDARIASALNKIIHNSQFKRRNSLEEQKAQKQDSFLRGRQIAYLIYEQFRVTGIHDSVENYLFTIVLRNDDIQEFELRVGWNFIVLTNRFCHAKTTYLPTLTCNHKQSGKAEQNARVRRCQTKRRRHSEGHPHQERRRAKQHPRRVGRPDNQKQQNQERNLAESPIDHQRSIFVSEKNRRHPDENETCKASTRDRGK